MLWSRALLLLQIFFVGNLPLLQVCSYNKTAIRKSLLGCQFTMTKYPMKKTQPKKTSKTNQSSACQVHVPSAARVSRSGEEKTGLEVNFHRYSVACAYLADAGGHLSPFACSENVSLRSKISCCV